MALRIETFEGKTIKRSDDQGNIIYPGTTEILADDELYAVGIIRRDGTSGSIYDRVVGYRGSGARVNGKEMEPGEHTDGNDPDLKYTALGPLESGELVRLPLRTL